MSTSPALHAPTGRRPGATGLEADLDLLEERSGPEVTEAIARIRESLRAHDAIERQLADALIATQDRVFALKALAQINVQGVASDQTIRLLLEKALELTGSVLVLLLDGGSVVLAVGDAEQTERCRALALRSIADAPDDTLRSAASGSALLGTLDPDGGPGHYAGFFRSPDHPFSTVDVPLVEAIVSALGVMLAFHDLHRLELARAAVEREHRLASELAQSVIVEVPPRSDRVEIFARTVPASLTGGDFYVFGEAEGRIWFAVGDVAGKGLPAAMLMTRAVAACRIAFLARRDSSVAEVFARIEDELFEHLDEIGFFITLAVGVLHEATGTVDLVNAGHSPVVRIGSRGAEFVPPSVPPVGVVRHRVPATSSIELGRGEVLVLGSDGLAEQGDPAGRLFGYDRFLQLCGDERGRRPEELGSIVFDTVAAFAAGAPSSDDSTLVVLGCREVAR